MTNKIPFVFAIWLLTYLISCKPPEHYDLAIRDVDIFDSEKGQVLQDKTILIKDDRIAEIISEQDSFEARETIDGNGSLAVPGFIDTHTHLGDIIGNYEKAPEIINPDSISVYRQRLADTYLKYGVTVIKDVGQPENWIPVSLNWQQNSEPGFPDIFISGSALISDEERTPYISHVEVKSTEESIRKVREYYQRGIKYLKLYWRLRKSEMKTIVEEGKREGMNLCAHIDNGIMTIDNALELGVKNFEHCHTITNSIFPYNSYEDSIWKNMHDYFNGINSYIPYELEVIQFVQNSPALKLNRDELIQRMIDNHASISTTIHLFGSICKRTYFNTYLQGREGADNPNLTSEQLKRLNKGFDTFMSYIKQSYDEGLKIRIGTDCQDGGKALLSELLLLYEAGFTLNSVLQIATINGAQSMGIDNEYGSLHAGKKANIVIFDKNPFDDYKNILSDKIIIKDGKVYKIYD